MGLGDVKFFLGRAKYPDSLVEFIVKIKENEPDDVKLFIPPLDIQLDWPLISKDPSDVLTEANEPLVFFSIRKEQQGNGGPPIFVKFANTKK